jgi:hypothetical protein
MSMKRGLWPRLSWHGNCMNAMGTACQRRTDTARQAVAKLQVDVLAEAGVERVYGVPGDNKFATLPAHDGMVRVRRSSHFCWGDDEDRERCRLVRLRSAWRLR